MNSPAPAAPSQLEALIQRINQLSTSGAQSLESLPPQPATRETESVKAIPSASSSAVSAGPVASQDRDEPFIPAAPKSLEEAGLSEALVEELLMRFLLARGEATGRAIADQLQLPFRLIEPILNRLKLEQLTAYRGANSVNDYTHTLTDQGRDDPVLGHLPVRFPIMQWHSDTFTLPPGAVHLATSPTAKVQAFRTGRAGYATQFHFEANRAVAADWAREFAETFEAARPGWVGDFETHAAKDADAADAHGLAIARAWVGLI